jgi:hypothetical protein
VILQPLAQKGQGIPSLSVGVSSGREKTFLDSLWAFSKKGFALLKLSLKQSLQIPIKEERIFFSPQIEQVLKFILFKVIPFKGEATKENKNLFKIKFFIKS